MTSVDPYEQLRLKMNETFDMSGDILQAPFATISFEAVSPEAAAAAQADMRRCGTLGYVEGQMVTVGLGCHVGSAFEDELAEVGIIHKIAAGR